MVNSKTCKFLGAPHLSVIACEADNVLQDFLKYVSSEYGKSLAERAVDEIDKIDSVNPNIVIVRGLLNERGERKLQIAQKPTAIKNIAMAHNTHFIVPLGLRARELRSVFSILPKALRRAFRCLICIT